MTWLKNVLAALFSILGRFAAQREIAEVRAKEAEDARKLQKEVDDAAVTMDTEESAARRRNANDWLHSRPDAPADAAGSRVRRAADVPASRPPGVHEHPDGR